MRSVSEVCQTRRAGVVVCVCCPEDKVLSLATKVGFGERRRSSVAVADADANFIRHP